MKKISLSVLFLLAIFTNSFSQVQSIHPDSAFPGQTLTTTITMVNGTFSIASVPYQSTDIYLQQGATIIYTYAGYTNMNVYGNPPFWFDDSLWTNFTIPTNAPGGYYDVHVITYDGMGFPTDWVLTNGFKVDTLAGSVEGDIYFDANQNGIRDGAEIGLANHKALINPGNIYSYTDASGHYKAYLDTNTYTVSYAPNYSFNQTSLPATYTAVVPPSYTGDDFGAYSVQQFYNQYLYVWHHAMRCQPAHGYTSIQLTNNFTDTVQGSITLMYSSNMTLNATVPVPDVVNGDTATWYYSSLAPGQQFRIYGPGGASWISFLDPPAGQTVWYTVIDSVYDLLGTALTQYADSFNFVVNCSCDPNEKFVSPQGTTAQGYTPPNTDLTFTVNFQNTGNDTAFNVVITDTLDANLDWNTFEVIGSTDPVYAQMDGNGVVTFTFQNIMLPDSNVDEPASHGSVAYRIRTDSLLPDPTVISNTAYIVFDWNSPVVTNTTINTITSLQYPSASFITGDVSFCPGSCINFSNLSSSATSYQWNFPGGNPASSTDADPSNICYTVGGNYDVQLIATNALGSDTVTLSNYLEVFTVAAQAITQSGDTLFANQGFVNYVWYYNGNIISGATDYFYVATQNGDYHVISYDANGCDVEAAAFNVLTGIQVAAGSGSVQLEIYPNPVREKLEIRNLKFVTGVEIFIYNIFGEKVMAVQQEASSKKPAATIDVANLPSGIYSVEINDGEKLLRTKFVKL